MMLIVLLRDSLLPWIDEFLDRTDRGNLYNGFDAVADLVGFRKMLGLPVSPWSFHYHRWCICSKESNSLEKFELAAYNPISLEKSFSWCMTSWGVENTGLMLAFRSSQEEVFEYAKASLARDGSSELILGSYSADEIAKGRFRGWIFSRDKVDRGKGIWPGICGPNGCALVFFMPAWTLPKALRDSNEIVITVNDAFRGEGICMRITSEKQFLELSRRGADLVVPDGLASSVLDQAVGNFEYINVDALKFALIELHRPAVIYVPSTTQLPFEILYCHSVNDTLTIMTSEGIQSSRRFKKEAFC